MYPFLGDQRPDLSRGDIAYQYTFDGAFADESSWSNEIGFAFAAIDDTVELRITGFDISIDDYQLERSVPQSTDYIVINADKVSSQGIESEIVWRPVPSFVLEGGIGLNDVTFDRYIDPFSEADLGGRSAIHAGIHHSRISPL